MLNNTLTYYTSDITFTLNSIININVSQDTSINIILNTLPSDLQTSTAASTYQLVGYYVSNHTLDDYTSNISFPSNNIINNNSSQDTNITTINNTETFVLPIIYSCFNLQTTWRLCIK